MIEQAGQQAKQLIAEMPVGNRVIAGLLVVAIAVSLGFLGFGSSEEKSEFLLGGRLMDASEMDAAEVAFGVAGLSGWRRDGRRMAIPAERQAEFLAAMQESGTLPMHLRTQVETALESFTMFDSNGQRNAKLAHAKEKDLGSRLTSLPDIRWADVKYDLGERRGLSLQRLQTASVMVHPEGSSPLSAERIRIIQESVRSSFAGMSVDDVTVIDANATSMVGSSDDESPLARRQRQEEARYEQRVRSHLSGYGPIRVAAHVEIDPKMQSQTTSLRYADQPTTLSESQVKYDAESSRPVPGGVPGTATNALTSNRPAKLEDSLATTRVKQDQRNSEKVAGQDLETVQTAGLTIRRVRVSVALPQSYYTAVWPQVWRRENPGEVDAAAPPMQAADLERLRTQTRTNIQTSVAALLPAVQPGEDPYPLVEVTDYPDLPIEAVAGPTMPSVVTGWLQQNWQTLAMIAVALAALVIARSALRPAGGEAPAEFAEGFGLELPQVAANDDEESEGGNDRMEITGDTLQSEMVSLVDRNPEIAANVIRGWVGDAA